MFRENLTGLVIMSCASVCVATTAAAQRPELSRSTSRIERPEFGRTDTGNRDCAILDISRAPIRVDGRFDDWENPRVHAICVQDPANDSVHDYLGRGLGTFRKLLTDKRVPMQDIKQICVAMDRENAYFRIDLQPRNEFQLKTDHYVPGVHPNAANVGMCKASARSCYPPEGVPDVTFYQVYVGFGEAGFKGFDTNCDLLPDHYLNHANGISGDDHPFTKMIENGYVHRKWTPAFAGFGILHHNPRKNRRTESDYRWMRRLQLRHGVGTVGAGPEQAQAIEISVPRSGLCRKGDYNYNSCNWFYFMAATSEARNFYGDDLTDVTTVCVSE